MLRKMLHFQFLDVAIQIIFYLVTVFVANTFVFLVSGLALFNSLAGPNGSGVESIVDGPGVESIVDGLV